MPGEAVKRRLEAQMAKAIQQGEELPLVLMVPDLQKALRIGRVKAYQLASQQGFPVIRLGRAIQTPREALMK